MPGSLRTLRSSKLQVTIAKNQTRLSQYRTLRNGGGIKIKRRTMEIEDSKAQSGAKRLSGAAKMATHINHERELIDVYVSDDEL